MSNRKQCLLYAVDAGYTVDRKGIVTSPTGYIPKVYPTSTGYDCFGIQNRTLGLRGKVTVHRLQAYTKFGDLIFQKGIQVRHLNNDKQDNSWENISIGSPRQNAFDTPADVRQQRSMAGGRKQRKLSDKQFERFMEDRRKGMSLNKLAKKYKMAKSTAYYILSGKTYIDM